jgi:hypothetical protein
MGQRFRVGQIVDRHKFEVRVLQRCPQNIAPYAPKTVNAYFYRHVASG